MKQVSVAISGDDDAGKSTILAIVERALDDAGYDVKVEDGPGIEAPARRFMRATDPNIATRSAVETQISLKRVEVAAAA